MTKLNQALSILNDPAARDVTFGDQSRRAGRVFVSPGKAFVSDRGSSAENSG